MTARRRDNIEDALTVLALVILSLFAGWRAHAVYGTPQPTPCPHGSTFIVAPNVPDATGCIPIERLP